MIRGRLLCAMLMGTVLEGVRDSQDYGHAPPHDRNLSQMVSNSSTQQRQSQSYRLLQPSSLSLAAISQWLTREAAYTFEPGELGMTFDDNGIVQEVSDNGQAHTQGVQKGYQIVKIGTVPFSKDALAQAARNGTNVELTFQVSKRFSVSTASNKFGLLAQLRNGFARHRSLFLFLFFLICAVLVFGEDVYYYVAARFFYRGKPVAEQRGCVDTCPSHEKVTVDENTRMFLNGETHAAMAHAKKLQKATDDHSIDEPWPIDEDTTWTDRYMLITAALWLIPKSICCVPVAWALCFPVVLVLQRYAKYLPTPTFQPDRASLDYWVFVKFVRVVSLPMLFFAIFCIILDAIAYYFWSIPYMLVTRGWSKYSRSWAAIEPYRGGPSLFICQSDIVACLLGQLCRHGCLETTFMLAIVWVIMPFVKYYMNANPFLYSLEGRFIQQITTSLQDMRIADIVDAMDRIVVDCKQDDDLAADVNPWSFVPHYPYAPPWKRWNIGIQSAGIYSFLFVHVTHSKCCNGGSTEQFVLSKSSIKPMFRVMLWYNNPYHLLTGWVEANLSSGLPSQPSKNRGGEHPMWLVGTRSNWSAARDGFGAVSFVDAFFDRWLPYIVFQVRKIVRGASMAEELREDVISKDGHSAPALQKAVPLVPP